MKKILILALALGSLLSFASEEIDFCNSRSAIVTGDGSGDHGIYVVAKSDHYSKDYYSALMCTNSGNSTLRLKERYYDDSIELDISDELCASTVKKMGRAIQLLTGFKAYKFVVANGEVVSVEKTQKKCKNL